MAVGPKQLQALLALPGRERFEHFVKVVADREEVWGLCDDGWALAGADDGTLVFPLWPAAECADACATEGWRDCEPRPISLHDLFDALLPMLKEGGMLPGIFPTPTGGGVTPSVEELSEAIRSELSRF